MKKMTFYLFTLVILFLITSCSNEYQAQIITVQSKTSENGVFEEYKEIKEKQKVKTVISIMENADWVSEGEELACHADYQFQFIPKYNSEGKNASYSLCMSQNDEILEAVVENRKYAELPKEDASVLYEILIGEE